MFQAIWVLNNGKKFTKEFQSEERAQEFLWNIEDTVTNWLVTSIKKI